jgi:hypothetical protein
MSDIVERLCAVESSEVCETTRTTTNWYRNPDGPEAADEITRLRAALKEIAERKAYDAERPDPYNKGWNDGRYAARKTALAALQETGDEQR